jgi:two-component system, cell cycle response regulator DivK
MAITDPQTPVHGTASTVVRVAGDVRDVFVVVVEDNERSRKLVHDLLELKGLTCKSFATAEEALEVIVADPPSLVVLDVQLPGMDGIAAAAALRDDPRTAGLPLVAVTAFAMPGDQERLLAAGFDAYISKPIDVRTFVDQLLAVLDGERA